MNKDLYDFLLKESVQIRTEGGTRMIVKAPGMVI